MRRKVLGKRFVAFGMAAMLGISSLYVPNTGVAVYAAEEQNTAEEVWSNNTELKVDLATDNGWTDKIYALSYNDGLPLIENVTVGTKIKVVATVAADDTFIATLTGDEPLKLGCWINTVVGEGDEAWKYAGSSDYPILKADSFKDGKVEVSFNCDIEAANAGPLGKIAFKCNSDSLKEGTFSITDVKVYDITTPSLPETAANVIADFEEENSNTKWSQETGWQYENNITIAKESLNDSNQLKLGLDYTGCEGYTWSEAKISTSFEDGLDVSAYNLLTYEITYPEAFDGYFKAKVFAKDANNYTTEADAIINNEGSIKVTDESNGMKTATVTVNFSPTSEKKITNITIGIVGVNTSFVGDVYIDNITLSQYNTSGDFVDITEEVGSATVADISKMPSSVALADANATDTTKALYAYLIGLDGANQVLFGHQNDTHKCVGTADGVYSDSKDITGSISGVVGIDSLALTGAELGLSSVDDAITQAVEISKKAASEGAIITLSTHMPNMSDAKIVKSEDPDANYAYDFSACDFAESKNLANNCSQEVLPGGKYNAQFKAYLDIIADYANKLGEADIPVMFRPFHENTGGWFWWGAATTDVETYKALWQYTVDYLTTEKNVHNMLFIYSPNGPLTSTSEYEVRYPGDDYVDIVGFDYYNDYNTYPATYDDSFMTSLKTTCGVVKSFADAHGKVAAISETGVRVMKENGSDNEGILVKDNPIKDQDWYNQVNNIAAETGMSYFLLWANFSDTNFYIPYKYNGKGQELINDFIAFYNSESSIFADGTNFYAKEGQEVASSKTVENTNKGTNVSGYFTNIFSKGVIKADAVLSATVKNATNVEFELANGDAKQALATKGEGNVYTATVTAADLAKVGLTDVGTLSLVADGKTLVTLSFMSFGKDKETLAEDVVENFELYYGDNDYLNGTFTENSAANCSSKFTLDSTNKSSGSFGGSFDYKLNTNGSEVWTGRMKGLESRDYSAYNAITMWVKPDGKGQKLVVQLVSNGEDFEAFLTDFVATTEAKYITIPFDQLKGKNGGTFDPKSITKFAIWCNSIPANGATNIDSSIVFDDIQFVNVNTSDLSIHNGYVVTDKPVTDSKDNQNQEDQTVQEQQTTIALNKTKATVKKGKTLNLKATVTPEGLAVTWKSSNKKVATVDKNGKVKGVKQGTATITATVTDKNGVTVEAKCKITVPYNITYKLNKGKNNAANPATYYKQTVKLKNPSRKGYTFKGWYTDKKFKNKITKISKDSKKDITLYAKWSKVTVKKASLKSVKNSSKKSMKVTVKKVSGAKGYTIVYSTDKKFKKNVKSVTTTKTSKTIKGLKKGKTYYVKVKAYKKDSAGKKVYGKYSGVKQVKIRK